MIKLENIVYTDSTNEIPLKLFNKTSIEIPDKGSIYLNTKHREKAISLFLMLTGKITPYSGEIHFEQEVRKDEFIYWDTFSKDSIELTVGDLLKSFPSYNQQERSGNEAVQQEAKISSSEDIDFLKLGLQIAIANRKKCIVLNVESLEKDALEEVISPFSHLLSIVVFVVDGGNEKQNIVRLDNKKDSYLARVSKISHSNLKKRPFKFAFSTFLNALFVMLTILFFSVRYNNVCRYEVSKLNSMGMKTAFIYDSQIHHSWKNVYLHTWNDTYGTRQSTEIIKSIDDERIRSAGGCKFNDLFLYDINIREDRTELDELGLEVDARLVNHVGSFGQKEGETYISSVLFDHLLQNGWRDEKGIHKLNEPGDIIGQVIDGRTIKGVYTTQWDKLYYSVLNKEGNYEKYSYILNRKSEFFALFTCDGSQINTVTSFVYLLSGNTTKDVLNLKRLNVKEKTGRWTFVKHNVMPIETLLNENGYAIGLMHPYHTYRNWIWNSLLITTGISSLGLSYSWTNRFKRREKNTLGIFYYNKELVKHKRAWHLISHATLSGASLVAGIILSLVAVFSIIAFEGGILYPSFDGIICILGAYLIPQLFLLLFDL